MDSMKWYAAAAVWVFAGATACGGEGTSMELAATTDAAADTDGEASPDTSFDTSPDMSPDSAIVFDGGTEAVWIQLSAGSFWMGTPDGTCAAGYPGGESCQAEMGRDPDEEIHFVELTTPFEMLSTEVTQAQWYAAFGNDPSYYGPSGGQACGGECPVERVNWFEAVAYANKLSEQAGLEPCYTLTGCTGTVGEGCPATQNWCMAGTFRCTVALNGVSTPYDCEGYRLPTESEWEYAIRAGSLTAFHPSDGNDGSITSVDSDPNLDQIGWYIGNTTTTRPRTLKEPNTWGLHDMSGNVWEWTWDWYQAAYPVGDLSAPVLDPTGPESGEYRTHRGGNFTDHAQACRSGHREFNPPAQRFTNVGFRVVRSLL